MQRDTVHLAVQSVSVLLDCVRARGSGSPALSVPCWLSTCVQIVEWSMAPLWRSGGEGVERAAIKLIEASLPSTPSVLTARHVHANGMPARLSGPVCSLLRRNGVQRLVVGGTPQGNCPTVIQESSGVQLVMATTSKPQLEGARYTPPLDTRDGISACLVVEPRTQPTRVPCGHGYGSCGCYLRRALSITRAALGGQVWSQQCPRC